MPLHKREQYTGATQVLLSLGSNLGDRESYLRCALQRLEAAGQVAAVSSVWETMPWGYDDHRPYLNMAVQLETRLEAAELHACLQKIELECGRNPNSHSTDGYKARELDIDILLYGQVMLETEKLIIPHPRLEKRNFVLQPLAEIAPDYVHPMLKKPIRALMQNSEDRTEVRKVKNGL